MLIDFLSQCRAVQAEDARGGQQLSGLPWDYQAAIDGVGIAVYQCPSDSGTREVRDPGGGKVRLVPTSYGFNLGTWFVYDPRQRRGGNGAFFPNSFVPLTVHGELLDVDYNSWQEGKNGSAGRPTYAIVTSRSYHPGAVHVALVDGSVQTVQESVALDVWRAMATRQGGERIE